eukprot:1143611-Pelagomonas_calceolata.AAC.3
MELANNIRRTIRDSLKCEAPIFHSNGAFRKGHTLTHERPVAARKKEEKSVRAYFTIAPTFLTSGPSQSTHHLKYINH